MYEVVFIFFVFIFVIFGNLLIVLDLLNSGGIIKNFIINVSFIFGNSLIILGSKLLVLVFVLIIIYYL